jgi:tRNA modification GTPase
LLNALAGEDRAIVTEVAGTTRDFVEAELSESGLKLTLIDTAGLRMTDDPVEKIGVERTLRKLKEVELILYVVDAVDGVTNTECEFFSAIPWEKTAFVVNKSDLNAGFVLTEDVRRECSAHAVSATNGSGLKELRSWLSGRIRAEVSEDSTLVSNSRHYRGLEELGASFAKALPLIQKGESPDLIALELQSGLQALHEILGLTYDDGVMDRVFAEFCLGK